MKETNIKDGVKGKLKEIRNKWENEFKATVSYQYLDIL